MGLEECWGAKGRMDLNRVWSADSQGRNEYFNNCVALSAEEKNDKLIRMTIQDAKRNGYGVEGLSEYVIAVDRPIDLIKKNGSKV